MSPVRLVFLLSVLFVGARPVAASPRELTFIYIHDADSTIMSGSMTDLERVKKKLAGAQRVLWFRTADGKELVVRDPATLNQFEAAWKTANALGEQQGVIGANQGVVGSKQGAIGSKQGTIGAKLGTLGMEEAKVEERLAEATSAAQRDPLLARKRRIDVDRHDLEDRMRVLDDQMRELDKPMRELEQQMRVVAKKHDAAAKQAQADTEALVARAIASGTAKPF